MRQQDIKRYGLVASAVVVLAIGGIVLDHKPNKSVSVREPVVKLAKAEPELHTYVEAHKASKDPKVQDVVGASRIKLGYLAAQKKDWEGARETFRTAEREYKGTGEIRPDFGGVADEAAYQAAVCLVAEHKETEAKAEFTKFIQERPLSPLVQACYRRLVRLNNNVSTPEMENLLQAAITKQEAHNRFETSVCGPKTIEYLLPQLKKLGLAASSTPKGSDENSRAVAKPTPGLATTSPTTPKAVADTLDYKLLAKLCGTTDRGTTMEGMRKGLKTLGITAYPYKLNRQDLAKISLPAILLEGDHYVAILKVDKASAQIYDTRFKAERAMKLPALDDPDFSVNVLVFSPLELDLQGALAPEFKVVGWQETRGYRLHGPATVAAEEHASQSRLDGIPALGDANDRWPLAAVRANRRLQSQLQFLRLSHARPCIAKQSYARPVFSSLASSPAVGAGFALLRKPTTCSSTWSGANPNPRTNPNKPEPLRLVLRNARPRLAMQSNASPVLFQEQS